MLITKNIISYKSLDHIATALKWILSSAAVAYVVAYLFVVFSRITYPFELMWLEGAYVDHTGRILDGYKYYVEPSLEFVSSIYTPFFFYFSAVLSKITGVGFFPLRLISVLSSLGSFWIIYLMVQRETGNRFTSLLASCLFSATFYLTGASFDIGRVDSLFLFLLLCALYLVRFHDSPKFYVLAGVLFSLSFFTKQTALVVSLPVMLYCIISRRQLAIYFIAPIILIVGLGSFLLNIYYDGWFNFYVFELPRTTPIDRKILLTFWPKDIVMPMGIAFSFGIFYLLSQLMEEDKKKFSYYFLVTSGAVVASWYSRYRIGYSNVLLPTYAIMSILFGLGLHKLLEINRSVSYDKSNILKIFLYLVCIVQFCSDDLIYNPINQIPTQRDLKAGREYVEKISRIDGEIFMYNHGYLPVLAGKKSYANIMGTRDIFFTDMKKHADIKTSLLNEFEQAVREKRFSAVILDSIETCGVPGLDKYYTLKEKAFENEDVFIPLTGTRTRPDLIYVPVNNGPAVR